MSMSFSAERGESWVREGRERARARKTRRNRKRETQIRRVPGAVEDLVVCVHFSGGR